MILGIESTAHTFGIGLINSNGKIIANEKESYKSKTGGMIPFELAEHHYKVADNVIKRALGRHKIKDIKLISFSAGPGIGHALRIGAFCARLMSLKHKIPIIGVNHCISHMSIGRHLTGAKDPVFLYASGANTQIIGYEHGWRILGETLDMGIGNFIDQSAREMGLGFPGGPEFEKLALKGHNFIELPYDVKGMDVNFGGLFTNMRNKIKKGINKYDLAYSVQETAFAMLIEVSERAMAHLHRNELLLGGGVGCNKRLQEMARKMCEERGAKLFVPEDGVLVDNGVMIAWQGYLEYKAGKRQKIEDTKIKPYWRTDES